MAELAGGYLLGLGSNINPQHNFAAIVRQLLSHFDALHLSRVLHIPPVGMNSHRDFLNAAAFIETDMAEADLKAICNQIETALGRDRDDPDSKLKDRPADIDILTYFNGPADWQRSASSITDEYFLYPLINELCAFLTGAASAPIMQKGTLVSIDGLTFGETAATIHRD
jgi:2-amino-4-hydroxy-6-hydroxymethyldihydropteridine diphosphokinase